MLAAAGGGGDGGTSKVEAGRTSPPSQSNPPLPQRRVEAEAEEVPVSAAAPPDKGSCSSADG